MRQCGDMKWHATGARWATGFLLVMLWLQVSLRVTEAANNLTESKNKCFKAWDQASVPPRRHGRCGREMVHLQTALGSDGKVFPLQKDGDYKWFIIHNTKDMFQLMDNSTLVVPRRGFYIVNLKMYYQITPVNKPECNDSLILSTFIKKYHSSYHGWLNVIKGLDTMPCKDHWRQSVTLSQVVMFDEKTKLKVTIDQKNYKFINGDESTFFSVTRL